MYWSYKTACEQGHRMIFYNLNKIEKHHQIILNLYMDSYENWFSLFGVDSLTLSIYCSFMDQFYLLNVFTLWSYM